MKIYECKNEYRGMLLLRMNIWGMSMLGVNGGMLGDNVLIGANI